MLFSFWKNSELKYTFSNSQYILSSIHHTESENSHYFCLGICINALLCYVSYSFGVNFLILMCPHTEKCLISYTTTNLSRKKLRRSSLGQKVQCLLSLCQLWRLPTKLWCVILTDSKVTLILRTHYYHDSAIRWLGKEERS